MAPELTNAGPEIAAICRRHGVRRLEVFGSAARGEMGKESDFDFLVDFISDDWHGAADRWFGLIEDLQKLLGREIDLTSAKTVRNPYFLATVNRDKREVYAA